MPISHSPCRRRYIGPLPSCCRMLCCTRWVICWENWVGSTLIYDVPPSRPRVLSQFYQFPIRQGRTRQWVEHSKLKSTQLSYPSRWPSLWGNKLSRIEKQLHSGEFSLSFATIWLINRAQSAALLTSSITIASSLTGHSLPHRHRQARCICK